MVREEVDRDKDDREDAERERNLRSCGLRHRDLLGRGHADRTSRAPTDLGPDHGGDVRSSPPSGGGREDVRGASVTTAPDRVREELRRSRQRVRGDEPEWGGPSIRLPAVCPWPVAVPLDARRVSGVLPHQRAVRVPCSAVQVPLLHGKARVSLTTGGRLAGAAQPQGVLQHPIGGEPDRTSGRPRCGAVGIENEEGVIAR